MEKTNKQKQNKNNQKKKKQKTKINKNKTPNKTKQNHFAVLEIDLLSRNEYSLFTN